MVWRRLLKHLHRYAPCLDQVKLPRSSSAGVICQLGIAYKARAYPRPSASAYSHCCCCCYAQVADLQVALREEQIIVEEKKAQTDELIVSIGKEKAVVDEAVEAGREDEEAASRLQNEVQAFQEECTKDLAAGV
jgi:hypothetical protein